MQHAKIASIWPPTATREAKRRVRSRLGPPLTFLAFQSQKYKILPLLHQINHDISISIIYQHRHSTFISSSSGFFVRTLTTGCSVSIIILASFNSFGPPRESFLNRSHLILSTLTVCSTQDHKATQSSQTPRSSNLLLNHTSHEDAFTTRPGPRPHHPLPSRHCNTSLKQSSTSTRLQTCWPCEIPRTDAHTPSYWR